MLNALLILAHLSVAQITPESTSARLVPTTEFKPARAWMPLAVGGAITLSLAVPATIAILVFRDVWVTLGIAALGVVTAAVILIVTSVIAVVIAISNAVQRDQAQPAPLAPSPEGTRLLEPGSAPPSSIVFRF